jgi:hypothetical protein
MKLLVLVASIIINCCTFASAQKVLHKKLAQFAQTIPHEYQSISSERKRELTSLVERIIMQRNLNGKAALVFSSNDNASASQMAQAWMQVAIEHYGLQNMMVSSYGENVKAIDKATVKSLKKSGFKVQSHATFSPKSCYLVSYSWDTNPMLVFSKKASNYQIPSSNVVSFAIDENSNANSDEMCRNIAREMFFVAEKIQTSHMLTLQP